MSDTNFSGFNVIKRLYRDHIRKYKNKLIIASICMVLASAFGSLTVWLVKPIIDKIFVSKDESLLYTLPFVVLIVHSLKSIFEYLQAYILKFIGQRVLCDLQLLLYDHLLKSDFEFISSQSSGKLISRFTNDISLMKGAASNLLVGMIKHFMNVIFLVCMMFYLDHILSFIVFFVFPLSFYPILQIARRMRKLSIYAQEQMGIYTSRLDETFNSIQIVKSYNAEDYESKKSDEIIENIFALYKKALRFDSLTSPFVEFLSGIAIFFIMIYGGMQIINDKSTTGTLMTFIAAFIAAYKPFKSLLSLNISMQDAVAASKRLFDVIDTKPKIAPSQTPVKIDCVNSVIEFKSVSLKYGEKTAIDNLSFKIEPMSKIAIVGKSGEGKTSIANLMLRFYDPNLGSIVIGNTDLKNIDIKDLRKQISLVTQNTFLFDATISENIAYATNATKEDIIKAAKAASADEFIEKLENGYDTVIGPQGRFLSGGQRQRIALARAFLKNSPIIILDEATSSLDPLTEGKITSAISKLCNKSTTIIITHKLHTITDVDKILVVKSGKIVEEGSFHQLMDLKGEFYKLQNSD